MSKKEKLINGYPYELHDGESIWRPIPWAVICMTKWADQFIGVDTATIESASPYVCQCGFIAFNVFASGDYETTAQCIQCKRKSVVHSG